MGKIRGPGTDPSTVAGKPESKIGGAGGVTEPTTLRWRSPLRPDGGNVVRRASFKTDAEYQGATKVGDRIYKTTAIPSNFIEVGVIGDSGLVERTYVTSASHPDSGTVDFPTEAVGMAGDGDSVYMVGGFLPESTDDGADRVYEYSIPNETITQIGIISEWLNQGGNLTNLGYTTSVIYHEGILYFHGGYGSVFGAYDTSTDADISDTVTDFPSVAGSVYSVKAGSSIYLHTGDGSDRTLYRYDIDTDTWTQLASLSAAGPSSGIGESPLVYDGEDSLYLPGGYSSFGIYKYSISEDSWSDIQVKSVDETESDAFSNGPIYGRHFTRDGSGVLEFIGATSEFTQASLPIEVVLE